VVLFTVVARLAQCDPREGLLGDELLDLGHVGHVGVCYCNNGLSQREYAVVAVAKRVCCRATSMLLKQLLCAKRVKLSSKECL
jgi:hypothetical protein